MIDLSVLFIGLCIVVVQSMLLQKAFLPVVQAQYRVLGVLFGIHLALILIIQSVGIGSYGVLLGVHTAVLPVLWLLGRKNSTQALREPYRRFVREWGFLVLLLVTPIALSTVYFNYSGTFNVPTHDRYIEADHLSYPYPSVSDEWYAIRFMQMSIETQALPLTNPYDATDNTFRNYQFPFHSLLTSFSLLFGINPLQGYVLLSIILNTLLVFMLYSVVRTYGGGQGTALLVATVALTIPWGANLLGLWCLIPATMGGILFMATLGEGARRDTLATYSIPFGVLMTTLFYPPYLVFLAPLVISSFLLLPTQCRTRFVLLISGIVTLLLGTVLVEPQLLGRLWYNSLLGPLQPQFVPHQLLPFTYILLAYVMVIPFKKRITPILTPWIVGLLLWALYAMSTTRIIVGYERVVVLVLFLTLILGGLGLERITMFFSAPVRRFVVFGVGVVAVVSVAGTLFNYTKHEDWRKLTAIDRTTEQMYLPGAPVIRAYDVEDAALFRDMRDARVLAVPWKGTILGVVSDVVPLTTQPGTISQNPGLYRRFITADCAEKKRLVREYEVDYTYTHRFTCDGFYPLARLPEGVVLQKVAR